MNEMDRPKPIQEEELNTRLNKLPPDIQSTIATYSSFFMEPDVYNRFKNNPNEIEDFKRQLEEFGFDQEAIDVTFGILGFEPSKNKMLNFDD